MTAHVGDIGTVIDLTITEGGVAVDISAATVKQIVLKGPTGEASTHVASFTTDGTDGRLKYTTVADDFNEAGRWRAQAFVTLPSGSWHSDVVVFAVDSNLEDA